MSEAPRTCFVHVGTHKTGTTSIQRFLALNRERFAAAGVFLPVSGCDNAPHYVSHHQLAYELTASPDFDSRFGGLADLADELRASTAPVALVSSENLSLLWHHHAGLVRLRDAIAAAGYMPKIICYLRPQASFATSVYAQIVCNADYRTPFGEYLEDVLARGRVVWGARVGAPFDYDRLIDPFAAVFGHDAVLVRPFRSATPDRTLLFDFARLIAASADFTQFAIPALRENGSLDFNTVLRKLGEETPTDLRIRFTPLRVRDVMRFSARFGHTNAEVAERYGLRLTAFEWIDVALALPFRRSVSKMRALALSRRSLARADATRGPQAPRVPVVAPRPALIEAIVAVTAVGAAFTSLLFGSRVASTALVEFGLLSIIVASSTGVPLLQSAAGVRSSSGETAFGVRLNMAGYACIAIFALVNALLDVGLARYEPDWISIPGAIAVAAAALVFTVVEPLRKLPGSAPTASDAISAWMRDDRMYLVCCYIVLFGQIVHAVFSDWWLDTIVDVLVIVLAGFKISYEWSTARRNGPRSAA